MAIEWDWVYPEIRLRVGQVIDDMAEEGHVVFAYSGHRSWEDQEALYNLGRSKESKEKGERIVTNALPGSSLHNYGMAVDVAFKRGSMSPWSEEHPWKLLGEKVRANKLQWGGDWERFPDRPHIYKDYGLRLYQLKNFYSKDKLVTVWTEIDKIRGVKPGLDWYGPQLNN